VSTPGKSIGDLIAELPEEERFILELHIVKGIAPAKIADALGVPIRAVESVITTGKSRLITALNQG